FFQAEDGIRDRNVTGVQTCALPILPSAPPATHTSASPYWIARNASPMEWVLLAHAVTTLVHFPFAPRSMATFPAAILAIIIGTEIGRASCRERGQLPGAGG